MPRSPITLNPNLIPKTVNCVIPDCINKTECRNLCKNHYQQLLKQGLINNYPKTLKFRKNCIEINCEQVHYGNGLCYTHWKILRQTEIQTYAKIKNQSNKGTQKRIKQKREAQATYSKTTKCKYKNFIRFMAKRLPIIFTEEQFEIFLEAPCSICNKNLKNTTGVGAQIINVKQPLIINNIKRICNVCKATKQTEDFNLLHHAKIKMRHHWRRTPFAIKALQISKNQDGKYQCSKCLKLFPQTAIDVDHIIPISRVNEYELEDLNEFAKRLYCDETNLTALCKLCHREKSSKEQKERMIFRKGFMKTKKEKP